MPLLPPIKQETFCGPWNKLHWMVLWWGHLSLHVINFLGEDRRGNTYLWLLMVIINYGPPEACDFHKVWACSLGDYCQLLVCTLSSYLLATSNWKLIDCLASSVYLLQIYSANILCECFEAWTLKGVYWLKEKRQIFF